MYVCSPWRVRPIGPSQDDLLVWRAGLDEGFTGVGGVQVAPQAVQVRRYLVGAQTRGGYSQVMQFGQDFAVQMAVL
jgi:hypothetical protein